MSAATEPKLKETPVPGRPFPRGLIRRLRAKLRTLFQAQYADAMELLDRAAGRKMAGQLEPDWRSLFTPERLKRWAADVHPEVEAAYAVGGKQGVADVRAALDDLGMELQVAPWSVEAPGVRDAINRAAFDLSATANGVTQRQLDRLIPGLRSELIQGTIQGEGYDWMAGRLKAVFGHADKYRAQRIAITETQRAVHQGLLEQYKESGVVESTQWLLSGAPCPQCFLPDTPVLAFGVKGVSRFYYSGPVVEIETVSGAKFTSTPNHPHLTGSGLVPALLVVEGDDLVRYRSEALRSPSKPDDQCEPPTIKQVFDAVHEVSLAGRRSVPLLPEQFHGDARRGQSDVEVVTADRLLGDAVDSCLLQRGGNLSLEKPLVALPGLDAGREPTAVLLGLGAAAGGVGRRRELLALFRGLLRRAEQMNLTGRALADFVFAKAAEDYGIACPEGCRELVDRLAGKVAAADGVGVDGHSVEAAGLLPDRDSAFLQVVADACVRDAVKLSDLLLESAGFVELDHVVNVSVRQYSGHVYNLETASSLYLVGNGIASSNCVAVADEHEAGVALGAEYAKVEGAPAAYSSVTAPPLHPSCLCSLFPILLPVERMPKQAA